jgi:hypothetical protein
MNEEHRWPIVLAGVLIGICLCTYWLGRAGREQSRLDEQYPLREWALVDSTTHSVLASGTSREHTVTYVAPGFTHRLYLAREEKSDDA